MTLDPVWSEELARRVDEALGATVLTDALVDRCLDLASRCDVTDPNQVDEALAALWRLARSLGPGRGPADGVAGPVALAVNIALGVWGETGFPGVVVNLGRQLNKEGLPRFSLAMYERALEIEAPPRPDIHPPPVAQLQYTSGDLLRSLGHLNDAEDSLVASLSALNPTDAADQLFLSGVLNNLGLVQLSRHQYTRARDTLVDALRAGEKGGETARDTAVTLDNLAQAEMALAAKAGPLWLNGFVNHEAAEHLGRAQHYLNRAQQLLRDLPNKKDEYVTSLVISADLALEWKRVDRASTYGKKAADAVTGGGVSAEASLLVHGLQGGLLVENGRADDAVELLRPLLERATTTAPRRLPSRFLTSLLRAAALTGDKDLTEVAGRMLTDIDDANVSALIRGAAESVARDTYVEFGGRAELVVGHAVEVFADGSVPEWVYDVVLNRKGVLAERQGLAWLHARSGGPAASELVDDVRRLRFEVSHVDLDGGQPGSIKSARRTYDQAVSELVEAEQRLYTELSAHESGLAKMYAAEVQARIGPDTILVDFMIGKRPDRPRSYLLFLVRPEGPIQVHDLGPVETVDRDITKLTELLETRPLDELDRTRRAARLDRIAAGLFSIEEPLPTHIVFAATGLWGRVPFGLLPDADGRPLIERHVVHAVPSARWLLRTSAPEADPGPSMVIGDPDFDLGFAEDLPFLLKRSAAPLPYASAELTEVADLLGVKPQRGAAATRDALLSADRPRVLHVATHGKFLDALGSLAEQGEPRSTLIDTVGDTAVASDRDLADFEAADQAPADTLAHDAPTPARDKLDARALHAQRCEWLFTIGPSGQLSRSALLLAGFNTWLAGSPTTNVIGSGLVTAGEFAVIDLAGTELVVLSACETGVGAVDYADGTLLGLRAAALAAGANCCIGSLWKVDDQRTAELMTALYRALPSSESAAAALRTAQLEIRDRDPDPFFWAGWLAEGGSSQYSA